MNKINTIKILFCEYCNWKKFLKDEDEKENLKCFSCGRLLRINKALDPQKKVEENKEVEKRKKQQEAWQEEILKFKENFKGNKNE